MSNFDFLKAINGEPIYCNGYRITAKYDPASTRWSFKESQSTGETSYWDKEGHPSIVNKSCPCNLTTDPPKKKVKKTVWVCIAKFLTDDRKYDTSLAYNTKEEASSKFNDTSDLYIGTYPIEIEVEG